MTTTEETPVQSFTPTAAPHAPGDRAKAFVDRSAVFVGDGLPSAGRGSAHPERSSRPPLDSFLAVSGFPEELAGFAKYEFDKHLYYYGAHFSNGYDRVVAGRDPVRYAAELTDFFWKLQPAVDARLSKAVAASDAAPSVFSNAYFGWTQPLSALGVRLVQQPWVAAADSDPLAAALLGQCRVVQELFRSSMGVFYSKPFHKLLRAVVANLEGYFAAHGASALMVPFTNGFFEGVSTEIFRRQKKPTFLCIHGLPGRFDWWRRGEHPVDYLVVWGEAMKRRIVDTGRPESTVLVSGHPSLSTPQHRPISSGLDRVLVLGYSQNGAPQLNAPHFHDRSLGLDYLWRVQRSLQKVGVTRARMRPHPSESASWYRQNLDGDFYAVDESRSITEALAQSTLVVGPTSTVVLEAAVAGINYVGFFPTSSQYNPIGDAFFRPDLPLDGSDHRFPVASNEDELVRLLSKGAVVDAAALPDYLAPSFKPEVILEVLKKTPRVHRSATMPIAGSADRSPSAARIHIPEVSEVPANPYELQVLHAVRPFTMTPPEVTLNAMRAVSAVEAHNIDGAIVECGVWRGGVSMAMLLQLRKIGGRRNVFLYDTFDGMSEPTKEDVSPTGEAASKLLAEHKKDESNHYWAFAPVDRVRHNIESTGYAMDSVRMIKGKVEDTIPGVIPDRIAVLRLDTDWYESTHHELIHLYSRLVPGGVLILDDYGFWQGARKAVDEFFATLEVKPELHKVHDNLNSCVRWCIKP